MNKRVTSSSIQKTSLLGAVSHAWRALRHRNVKLFFAGQSISVIGTWMTRRARSWLNIRRNAASMLAQMREGWDYVSTFRSIRTILLLFALISLIAYPYGALLPVLTRQYCTAARLPPAG